MIQRMTELDTPEEKKQQLDEMASMNISMSGETADDVASLMKIMQNAGMNDAAPMPQETMPARQDMERLSSIVSDPAPTAFGGDTGAQTTVKGLPPGQHEGAKQVSEEWSTENAKELESLHNMVRKTMKGGADAVRAKRGFEDHVNKTFTGVDSSRLLMKLKKMDDRGQVKILHDLVRDSQRQNTNPAPLTYENLEEWSAQDADILRRLHGLIQRSAAGNSRDGAEFEDYIDNNFPNVNSEELRAKLEKMDDNQQFETLHDMLRFEYQNDAEDDYTDRSMRSGEMGLEGYDNEPDEDYQDTNYMTKDLSGGLNRQKKSYKDAEDGDNPMAVKEGESQKRYESIKDSLYAQLTEKKKADKDYDKDGKIETPKAEYQGSKIRAAKKKGNMKKDE